MLRGKSLSFRLLLAEGLALTAFFALVAIILEQGFRDSAEKALRERLQVQVYSLLSSVEINHVGELHMPEHLPEPRFTNPGSGLYGFIQQKDAELVWQSPSALGLEPITPPRLKVGDSYFASDPQGRYVLHYEVIWQNTAGMAREYTFTVAEDAEFVRNQVEQLEETLRLWLAVIGLVLVAIQFALLRWSLKPLRNIAADLEAIEHGEKTHLDGIYPRELQGLVGNLNAFINMERAHLERYRNNLADLAHSLKTPLAILRGCAESFSANVETVKEQISRMDQIVEYQLHRAAAKGEQKTIKSVDLALVADKIIVSLNKVYLDKGLVLGATIPESCVVYCEEGDLYEIVGNLLDNACKWCRQQVTISVTRNVRHNRKTYSVAIQIEDDGAGIPPNKINDILKRGVRADENIHGHGIGMSVVNELVTLLGGQLEGGKSQALGGMRWNVYLP